MRINKESIISWGCVYKVKFPNGKIYVGSDTAMTARIDFFKYFGSPVKAKEEMAIEMSEYIEGKKAYVVKKEILHAEENVRVGDVLQIEQQFIKALNAKDPKIGYKKSVIIDRKSLVLSDYADKIKIPNNMSLHLITPARQRSTLRQVS